MNNTAYINVGDTVEFHSTSDNTLNGKTGSVVGLYGRGPEAYPIVMFTLPKPIGYDPAIVITPYCVKKV
jgi:hypothetical protein